MRTQLENTYKRVENSRSTGCVAVFCKVRCETPYESSDSFEFAQLDTARQVYDDC
jgi:hypothetical protein